MKYYVNVNGFEIVQAVYGEYGEGLPSGFFEVLFEGDINELFNEYIWTEGGLKHIGPAPFPQEFYRKSEQAPYWVPNCDAALAFRSHEVNHELARRLYLPCNGFDADKTSRERISGMIARLQRGDGLPAGWLGWRDASNDMHWAADDAATVLANLTALSRAIEDREQALLVASWTHKANIAALTDIDAIIGYDVTVGWPS